MANQRLDSEFFDYLISTILDGENETDRLPPLNTISQELGVSVALLREQLEVAKALGFVEVRPRTGIRRLPLAFLPQSGKVYLLPSQLNQTISFPSPYCAAR